MKAFRADLHTHTTFSDGSCNLEELLDLAQIVGLNAISITDHDTALAYPEAIDLGKKRGLYVIPGAEFSSKWEKESIHILAYSYKIGSAPIEKLIEHHKTRRKKRIQAMLDKLKEHGMPLHESDLPQDLKKNLGRPHIGLAMLKKGYVKSIQEAFSKWIGEECPCYEAGNLINVKDTIASIHEASGFAVLAHPQLIKNSEIIEELLEMPFDGIECYYGNLPPHRSKRWEVIAARKKCFMTGGSDFHGTIKPDITLGSSWTRFDAFEHLRRRFEENHAELF